MIVETCIDVALVSAENDGMGVPALIALIGGVVVALVVLVVSLRSGSTKREPVAKDRQTMIREANRALSSNPKDAHALRVLADAYYDEQQWDKALKTYTLLVELLPTNPDLDAHEINMRHGLAAMQLKKYEEAHRSLVLARQENDGVFEIDYNLGRLELMRRNYEKAINLLRSAQTLRPDYLPTMRYLGQALFRKKRHREALQLLQKVLSEEPDDKETQYVAAQAYFEIGQTDAAGRIFGHLRADPSLGPRASLMSGSIHLKGRRYEAAETDFLIGLKHESIEPEVVLELKYRLAAVYTRTQQVSRAVPILTEIQQMNPEYKDVGAQLERGRELATNKNLQTYLIAPTSEFVGLCRRIVTRYFERSKVKITDINVSHSEYADVLAEIHTAKWEDIILFRFVRSSGSVGELLLRDLHSRIKDMHAGRGFCLSAGTFTDGAKQFVEARLIDILDKESLTKILKRV